MKEYKKPVLEIINIDGDVITASGCDPDFVKCVEKCVVPDKCMDDKCIIIKCTLISVQEEV